MATMNAILHSLLISLALVLAACGAPAPDQEQGTTIGNATDEVSGAAHDEHDGAPAQLDNGRRWKANPETTAGIANMVGILAAYDQATGDPEALKAALEEEFGLIFERCTMTGEAHEQLHNYLLPIHHQLRGFEATEVQRTALGERLAAYGKYFE